MASTGHPRVPGPGVDPGKPALWEPAGRPPRLGCFRPAPEQGVWL